MDGISDISNVLPFRTREEFDKEKDNAPVPAAELTAHELYRELFRMSMHEADYLIKKFKSTGNWNPAAARHAHQLVQTLKNICSAVAGEQHATKDNSPQISSAETGGIPGHPAFSHRGVPVVPFVTYVNPGRPAPSGNNAV